MKHLKLFENFSAEKSDYLTEMETLYVNDEIYTNFMKEDFKINVKWSIIFYNKDWGLKDIDFEIHDITGTYTIDDKEHPINMEDYEIKNEMSKSFPIYPTTIKIDTDFKIIEVS